MTQAVILLCYALLADDSDTAGYHFLTSVIKTDWEEAQNIPHVPGFCPSSLLSAVVETETSCSHSGACQSCRLHT